MKTKLLVTLLLGSGICSLQADEFDNPNQDTHRLKPLVESDLTGVFIDAPVTNRLIVMNMRLYDTQGNLVSSQHSRGESIVVEASGLTDGQYRYEAIAVIAGDDDGSAQRQFGQFEILDGEIVDKPVHLPRAESVEAEFDQPTNPLSQALQHGLGTVLSWITPTVYADTFTNVVVKDSNPFIDFLDTDETDMDWSLTGNSDLIGFFDYFNLEYALQIDRSTDNVASIHVDTSGDIHLANNALLLDRSTGRLGLGTTSPEVSLDIHDVQPRIELFNENVSKRFRLRNDNGQFQLTGDSGQRIINVDSDAPADVLTINASGNIGVGTHLPGSNIDIVDSFPNIRLTDSDNDTRASLRYSVNKFSVAGNSGQQILALDATSNGVISMNSQGDVGIGTNSPAAELQVNAAQPTIALQTDPTSGSPATWAFEAIGNAATSDFRLRHPTALTAPFRIASSAANDLVRLRGDFVGIGGTNVLAAATLHVLDDTQNTKILVEELDPTAAPRTLFELKNRGNTKFEINNIDAAVSWAFANPGSGFRVSRQGSGVVEFDLLNNGNLTIAGTLTENSDRNAKTNIVPIDQQAILKKVAALPIQQWQYKDALGENHIGPMAQDFYAAFGLGSTDKGIATLDSSGVALAAIQALTKEVTALKADNMALRQGQQKLEAQLKHQQSQLAIFDQLWSDVQMLKAHRSQQPLVQTVSSNR